MLILIGLFDLPHFLVQETSHQKGSVTCQRSHSGLEAGPLPPDSFWATTMYG